jgi:hypothetical protein
MPLSLTAVGDRRSARYLSLGAALLGSSAAGAMLVGCADEPPPPGDWGASEQAMPEQGVVVVIRETEEGYVIDDEKVVEGPSRVVIAHADGRTETLDDPAAFASRLPAEPPREGVSQGGFGLGDVLFWSLMMNVWRPAAYPASAAAAPLGPGPVAALPAGQPREQQSTSGGGAAVYAGRGRAPSGAFGNDRVYAERPSRTAAVRGLQSRGMLPATAAQATAMRAQRTAPATRSTRPGSGSRSGYGRASGRGGGG